MNAKKVNYEQLMVGGLLKFGIVDDADMQIMMEGLGISYFDKRDISNVSDYFENFNDGKIVFNTDKIETTYESDKDFYLGAREFQGSDVKEYFENLDMVQYVLRKIKLLGNVSIKNICNVLCFSQRDALDELYEKKYIFDYWHKNSCNDDYKAVKISKRGDAYLFLKDHSKEIEDFLEILRECIYVNKIVLELLKDKEKTEKIIFGFLMSQDLEREVSDILTIDNFLEYSGCLVKENNSEKECNKRRARIKK